MNKCNTKKLNLKKNGHMTVGHQQPINFTLSPRHRNVDHPHVSAVPKHAGWCCNTRKSEILTGFVN